MALIVKYRFNNTLNDLFPTFNEGFRYSYEDVIKGKTTIRSITSDSSPTKMQFGQDDDNSPTDKSLSLLEIIDLDVESLTTCSNMFRQCQNVKSINMTNFNTYEATSMSYMFSNCISLVRLNLSNLNVSKVTNMSYMFSNCSELMQLDISNFNTISVNNVTNMFYNCSKLKRISMHKTLYPFINDVISQLPTRSADSRGRMIAIGVTDFAQVNDASSKYWDVRDYYTIKYTFDKSRYDNMFPSFNSGFTNYAYEDVTNGNMVTRTLQIYGQPTRIQFGQNYNTSNDSATSKTLSLTKVEDFDVDSLTTLHSMFRRCSNATNIDMEYFATEKATSMDEVFNGCSKLVQYDASNWNTSKMTSAYNVFRDCGALIQVNTNNWNLSKIKEINGLFEGDYKLRQVEANNWDTSNITKMHRMFFNCQNLIQVDVSSFDTSKVQTLNHMFYNCYNLTQLDLSSWDVSSVTNMSYMFNGCSILNTIGNVGKWNTGKVTTTNHMFYGCKKITEVDMSGWNTSKITDMGYMFDGCAELSFLGNIDSLDLSAVTSMGHLFTNCKALTKLDLNNWKTPKVSNMDFIFQDCSNLAELRVDNWDTSMLTTLSNAFERCSSLTYLNLNNWDMKKVQNISWIFNACSKLSKIDINEWDTSNIRYISGLFYGCSSLTELNLNDWDVSNVESFTQTFENCTKLSHVEVSKWNLKSARNMQNMFKGCTSLLRFDANDWDLSMVNNVYGMFKECYNLIEFNAQNWKLLSANSLNEFFSGCSKLSKANIGNWKFKTLTDLSFMFYNCESLAQLDVSNWEVPKLTNANGMFFYCKSLKELDLGNWNTPVLENSSNMFSDCTGLKTLDISNFDLSQTTSSASMFNVCSSLKDIGMIYCNKATIERVGTLASDISRNIWVKEVPASELEPIGNITYREYKEDKNKLYLTSPLLPNDKLLIKNDGIYHFHAMEMKTLDGSETWSWIEEKTINNTLLFQYTESTHKYGSQNIICDNFYCMFDGSLWDSEFEGCSGNITGNQIRIRIKADRLSVARIDGFVKWLRENPVTIIHELEYPYYEKISDNIYLDTHTEGTFLRTESDVNIKKLQTLGYTETVGIEPNEKYRVTFSCDKENELILINLGGTVINHTTRFENEIFITTPSTLGHSQLQIDGWNCRISNQCVTKGELRPDYFEGLISLGDDVDEIRVDFGSQSKTLKYYNPTTFLWEKIILREWDTIECHHNKYYYCKKTGEITLNGNEDWITYTGEKFDEYFVAYVNVGINSTTKGMSGIFKIDVDSIEEANAEPSERIVLNSSVGEIMVYISKTKLKEESLEGFREWLVTNPVKLIYQSLNEEIYECTDLDYLAKEADVLTCENGAIPHNGIEISLGWSMSMILDEPLKNNERIYWNNVDKRFEIEKNGSIKIPTIRSKEIDLPRLYQRKDTNLEITAGSISPNVIIEYKDISR